MFTASFWADAAERAVRTAAQTALGVLGADGTGLLTTGPAAVAVSAGLAALVSLITSLAASASGDKGTASFLPLHGRHES